MQSKDNTCPTCGGTGESNQVVGHSYGAQDMKVLYGPCGECGGSGQQEGKPTKCRNCSDARLCDKHHEELYTGSKPEKPQGWDMEAAKESHLHTAHKRCFKCDKRDEPSKPDQLRERLIHLIQQYEDGWRVDMGLSQGDLINNLEALIYQRELTAFEQGQFVAYRLLKNQPEGSLKALIDENLERLKGQSDG
jgi:hypothetical protein